MDFSHESWLVEFKRKLDEFDVRMEQRWGTQAQRGAAVKPRIGDLEQTSTSFLVKADNWGGLFDEIYAPDSTSSNSSSPTVEEEHGFDLAPAVICTGFASAGQIHAEVVLEGSSVAADPSVHLADPALFPELVPDAAPNAACLTSSLAYIGTKLQIRDEHYPKLPAADPTGLLRCVSLGLVECALRATPLGGYDGSLDDDPEFHFSILDAQLYRIVDRVDPALAAAVALRADAVGAAGGGQLAYIVAAGSALTLVEAASNHIAVPQATRSTDCPAGGYCFLDGTFYKSSSTSLRPMRTPGGCFRGEVSRAPQPLTNSLPPATMGQHLPRSSSFYIHFNKLRTFPDGGSKLPKLQLVHYTSNRFNGAVPVQSDLGGVLLLDSGCAGEHTAIFKPLDDAAAPPSSFSHFGAPLDRAVRCGRQALTSACALCAVPGPHEKKGYEFEELRKRIADFLMECIRDGDTAEAFSCIRELAVSLWHHELVRRALIFGMRSPVAIILIVKLLKEASAGCLVSTSQILTVFLAAWSLDDFILAISSAKPEPESGGLRTKPPWPPPKSNMPWFQLCVSLVLSYLLRRSTVPFLHCVCCQKCWKLWLGFLQGAVQAAELKDFKLTCSCFNLHMLHMFPRQLLDILGYLVHLNTDRRTEVLLVADEWGLVILLVYIRRGVILVEGVYVLVAVTIAETGATLWKPPSELPALVDIIDTDHDAMVDAADHEHEATYVVPVESSARMLHLHLHVMLQESIEKLEIVHFPWDPGGSELIHRLGGKPRLKKGGMSGTTYGWAFTWAVGLGLVELLSVGRPPSSNVYKREYDSSGEEESKINQLSEQI